MAAVVEDTEGPKTDFLVVEMAPKNEEVPSLQISDGNNDTIEVDILAPNVNMECEVGWALQKLNIFLIKLLTGGAVRGPLPFSGRNDRSEIFGRRHRPDWCGQQEGGRKDQISRPRLESMDRNREATGKFGLVSPLP